MITDKEQREAWRLLIVTGRVTVEGLKKLPLSMIKPVTYGIGKIPTHYIIYSRLKKRVICLRVEGDDLVVRYIKWRLDGEPDKKECWAIIGQSAGGSPCLVY